MRLTRVIFWVSFVAVLAIVGIACGPGEEAAPSPTKAPTVAVASPTATATPVPTPTPSPRRGGQIVQWGFYPAHWDQTQLCCPDALVSLSKIYLTAMWQPTYDTIECDLCTRWSLEDGSKTIVMELHGKATFHDGTPIKAKDIKYSLEKLTGKIDGVVNIRSGFIKEYIDRIEAPDDKTLKIYMKRPAPIVPEALTISLTAILPEGTKRADLTEAPVGPNSKYTSGPFYLKEAVRDSHLLLERYPNYFKEGKPYLDSIKLQVFTDASAAGAALQIGRVDMSAQLAMFPPAQFWPTYYQMVKDNKLKVIEKPYYCPIGNTWLNFNNPLFQDVKVRQAFNLAMDRVEYGTIKYVDWVPALYFPVGSFWGRPESEIWDIVPGYAKGAKKEAEKEQARKLLADAGFPKDLELKLLTPGFVVDDEFVQRSLKNVGVNAVLDTRTDAQQRWGQGNFSVMIFWTCLAIGDPDELVANYFIKGGGRNFTGYTNPKVEALYLQMSSEQDPIKRKQFYRQIEDILIEDVANIKVVHGKYKYWYKPKIKGFDENTTGITLYRVGTNRGENWWLSE